MSLINELKRRNVFRVAIAYGVVAWVLAQIADLGFENFGAPGWVAKSVLFILVLGFPLAVFFAWAFELTPEGIKREKDVDRDTSITAQTGKKLNGLIIALLVVAVVVLLVERSFRSTAPTPNECSANDQSGGLRGLSSWPAALGSEDGRFDGAGRGALPQGNRT